jgi:hypothetical protein
MTRVVALLNEKNHYLEKFFTLNETELANFVQGKFDNLEYFYQTRDRILDVVKYIDAQIEKENFAHEAVVSDEMKKQVRESLKIKDQYVSRIIEQDIQVLTCIESAKNQIIRELQNLQKSKKAVGGYKVKTFDQRLNEEV